MSAASKRPCPENGLRHLVTALNKVQQWEPTEGGKAAGGARARPPSGRAGGNSRPQSGVRASTGSRPSTGRSGGRPSSGRVAESLDAAARVYLNRGAFKAHQKLYAPARQMTSAEKDAKKGEKAAADKAHELMRVLHQIEHLKQATANPSSRVGQWRISKDMASAVHHGQRLAEECFAGFLQELGLALVEIPPASQEDDQTAATTASQAAPSAATPAAPASAPPAAAPQAGAGSRAAGAGEAQSAAAVVAAAAAEVAPVSSELQRTLGGGELQKSLVTVKEVAELQLTVSDMQVVWAGLQDAAPTSNWASPTSPAAGAAAKEEPSPQPSPGSPQAAPSAAAGAAAHGEEANVGVSYVVAEQDEEAATEKEYTALQAVVCRKISTQLLSTYTNLQEEIKALKAEGAGGGEPEEEAEEEEYEDDFEDYEDDFEEYEEEEGESLVATQKIGGMLKSLRSLQKSDLQELIKETQQTLSMSGRDCFTDAVIL